MANNRIEFQKILENILGTRNVYFQPPSTIRMVYPAIVYKRDMLGIDYADDLPYSVNDRYSVTYIDRNPDSDVPMKLAHLRYSAFSAQYSADNLYHTVFTVYF